VGDRTFLLNSGGKVPTSGSLLGVEGSNPQAYPDAGFRRDGLSYLGFLSSQII